MRGYAQFKVKNIQQTTFYQLKRGSELNLALNHISIPSSKWKSDHGLSCKLLELQSSSVYLNRVAERQHPEAPRTFSTPGQTGHTRDRISQLQRTLRHIAKIVKRTMYSFFTWFLESRTYFLMHDPGSSWQ